jgi:hypothetical protein
MPLTLIDLLAKGYFPIELPPPFSTTAYAQALAAPGVAPPTAVFATPPRYSPSYRHNLVRAGGLRRNLGIPNPKHFFRLATHVVDHWPALAAQAGTSPFSLTTPVDTKPERAISPRHDLAARTSHRARLRASARFILKTDISLFFPSIYTHALPWALMGKAAAKAAHAARTLAGTWEDMTDVLSRSVNNNQTIGIPIGPDTSRLSAEVVLSRVDTELANVVPGLTGHRYIDDYEFAFGTRSDAEHALHAVQERLHDFELALNASKTAILELPETLDPLWTSQIRVFNFRNAGVTGQRNDLTAYFDLVFDYFKRFPDEGLLKYAIARLRDQEIAVTNWPIFESILSHCALIEPACLPQVCDQLLHYSRLYPVRQPLWADCLNRIVSERVPLGQASEAVWAMWVMKILGVRLSPSSEAVIGRTEDSAVGLMALGLAVSGLANPAGLSGLHRLSAAANLFDSQWLLCYQGNLTSWLGPDSGPATLAVDPAMDYLATRQVSFFDINTPPPPPIRHALAYYGGGGGGSP